MGHLTEAQKKFFKENGYIVLKNIFSDKELNKVTEEYEKLFKRQNEDRIETSWVGSNDRTVKPDSPYTVKGVHNLQYHHAVFSNMLHNENLLDALEDILETENIMLHHTKAHWKPPENGASYPMHQDYHYFPHERDAIVAVFVHLDASNQENGGLCVYPGSHKLGPQEDIGAKESHFHYVDKKKFPLERATPVDADRGDVVIFSYLLIHGSPLNTSTRPRRMFLAQFLAADNKPTTPQRFNPGYGWMLRGVNLNKEAATAKRYDKEGV